jgi:cellulose synthase/poly-beta-1,6-N-acetylglucosamine synthase-like glycosyltransferase
VSAHEKLSYWPEIVFMPELRQRISYRQVRVVGALLMLQGVGLLGLGVYFLGIIDWDQALVFTNEQGQIHVQTIDGPWLKPLEQAALFAIFFLPPAVLLLLAGLSFLILRRRGWLLATIAQSLILLVCLFAYPDPRPGFAYPFIAYCILMVLYLNSRSVRTVFHFKEKPASSRSRSVHEA